MTQIESISSRELSSWLFCLAVTMEFFENMHRMLGVENHLSPQESSAHVEKVAGWLYDAKFEIRDPFPLRMAVRDLLKDFDERRESHQLAEMDEPIEKLRKAFEPFRGML